MVVGASGNQGVRSARRAAREAMSLFPIFIKLEGRQVLVVGAGKVAEAKLAGLVEAGAVITVVAPTATATVRGWARDGFLTWRNREFQPGDLDDVILVVAAVPKAIAA